MKKSYWDPAKAQLWAAREIPPPSFLLLYLRRDNRWTVDYSSWNTKLFVLWICHASKKRRGLFKFISSRISLPKHWPLSRSGAWLLKRKGGLRCVWGGLFHWRYIAHRRTNSIPLREASPATHCLLLLKSIIFLARTVRYPKFPKAFPVNYLQKGIGSQLEAAEMSDGGWVKASAADKHHRLGPEGGASGKPLWAKCSNFAAQFVHGQCRRGLPRNRLAWMETPPSPLFPWLSRTCQVNKLLSINRRSGNSL